MKRIKSFCLVWLFLAACQEKEPQKKIPKNLIAPAKMEAFLYEIHEAEAKVLLSGIRQDSAAALYDFMEKKIIKKHKLDSGKINQSIQYYNQHPEKLDSMYAALLKRTEK
jgi:hypothetical protein